MLSFCIVLPLLPYYAQRPRRNASSRPDCCSRVPARAGLRRADPGPAVRRLGPQAGAHALDRRHVCALIMLGLANSLADAVRASRIIDGITGGNISVAQAYITDVTAEKDRGQAFGLIGAAFGLGFILGPATGGFLSQYGHTVAAVRGGGARGGQPAARGVRAARVALRRGHARRSGRAGKGAFNIRELCRARSGYPRVGPLMTVRIVIGFTFAVFEGGFSLWAANALGITAARRTASSSPTWASSRSSSSSCSSSRSPSASDDAPHHWATLLAGGGLARRVGLLADAAGARALHAVPLARAGGRQHHRRRARSRSPSTPTRSAASSACRPRPARSRASPRRSSPACCSAWAVWAPGLARGRRSRSPSCPSPTSA